MVGKVCKGLECGLFVDGYVVWFGLVWGNREIWEGFGCVKVNKASEAGCYWVAR